MLEQITSAAYQYFLWLFSFHSKILWKHKETHVIYQYFNGDIQNCKIGKSCTQYQKWNCNGQKLKTNSWNFVWMTMHVSFYKKNPFEIRQAALFETENYFPKA